MKYKFKSTRKNLIVLKANVTFIDGKYETDDKKIADILKASPFVTAVNDEQNADE